MIFVNKIFGTFINYTCRKQILVKTVLNIAYISQIKQNSGVGSNVRLSVLVTFLFLCQNTIIKAPFKIKYLI